MALNTIFRVWLYTRFLPWAKRMAEEQERLRAELRERLGREPTDDELFDYLAEAES